MTDGKQSEKHEAKRHMSVEDVAARIASIEASSRDVESAHSQEDGLWQDVLQAIADGAPDPAELAREALKTSDISFPRLCV